MNTALRDLLKFCDDNKLTITYVNTDYEYPLADIKYQDGETRTLLYIDGDWE